MNRHATARRPASLVERAYVRSRSASHSFHSLFAQLGALVDHLLSLFELLLVVALPAGVAHGGALGRQAPALLQLAAAAAAAACGDGDGERAPQHRDDPRAAADHATLLCERCGR